MDKKENRDFTVDELFAKLSEDKSWASDPAMADMVIGMLRFFFLNASA